MNKLLAIGALCGGIIVALVALSLSGLQSEQSALNALKSVSQGNVTDVFATKPEQRVPIETYTGCQIILNSSNKGQLAVSSVSLDTNFCKLTGVSFNTPDSIQQYISDKAGQNYYGIVEEHVPATIVKYLDNDYSIITSSKTYDHVTLWHSPV